MILQQSPPHPPSPRYSLRPSPSQKLSQNRLRSNWQQPSTACPHPHLHQAPHPLLAQAPVPKPHPSLMWPAAATPAMGPDSTAAIAAAGGS